MTPLDLAMRFVGELRERRGGESHPFIAWCHELAGMSPSTDDNVPWCSSFVNAICWMLRLPRSKSARARSWLDIGTSVDLAQAEPGYDIAVFSRGVSPTAGHVGFFAGTGRDTAGDLVVRICGGNQGDNVTVASFLASQLLGIRRVR